MKKVYYVLETETAETLCITRHYEIAEMVAKQSSKECIIREANK